MIKLVTDSLFWSLALWNKNNEERETNFFCMNWNKRCLLMLGMGGLASNVSGAGTAQDPPSNVSGAGTAQDPPSNVSGAGTAQWLGWWTHNQKVQGLSPRSSGKIIFLSRVNFMSRPLFQYPFHTCVTTVTHKRSWSFCQKRRWQVTAKRTCTIWLWVWLKEVKL